MKKKAHAPYKNVQFYKQLICILIEDSFSMFARGERG